MVCIIQESHIDWPRDTKLTHDLGIFGVKNRVQTKVENPTVQNYFLSRNSNK